VSTAASPHGLAEVDVIEIETKQTFESLEAWWERLRD
jgi:hypothetical protein